MSGLDHRPVLLDLFGGHTGGAARGYQLAGFRVISVDLNGCPENPADERIKGDVFEMLPILLAHYRPDAVHASPPCQGNGSIAQGTMPGLRDTHPDLIPATREMLAAAGLPFVIENPQHSRSLRSDVMLCGEMFRLGVIMHRSFELGGWTVTQPKHEPHRGYVRGWRHGIWRDGPYVAAYGKGGGKATVDEMRKAKGIDWSTDHLGLRDALPPAYTQWIGTRLMGVLR